MRLFLRTPQRVNSDTYTLFKGPGQEFVDYMNKIVSYSDVKTTPGELGVDDKDRYPFHMYR